MKGSIGRQRLRTWLPFLSWRSRVTPASLRADFSAGLTGSLILVPQGVAFATIAGMPPEYGLYAAMVPVVIAALFGSSWHMVSGPTTAISIVVFASLSPLAEPGSAAYVQLALTLSFLSGCIMLALGWLRLGSLMNFVSHTVVVGFTAGAAVLIATSQLKNFFGLPIPRGATFAQAMQGVFTQWDAINPWVMLVAVSTLLSSVLVRRYLPRMPHMIAGLAVGSAVAAALNAALGPGRTGIETLAALPRGLPPLSLPDVSAESFRQLLPIAVALSMLSLTEALSIARALALKTGQRIDSNQEFLGQGLSNVLGSLFSAYPSSGSFNRSGLNLEAGACTPLAAVISAVLLVAILQFVAPWAVYLPLPAMAGVLMLVAWGLFDVRQATHILTHSRQESAVLVATFLATLFLQLEFAIYAGVALSLMLYLNRTSRPHIEDVKPVQDEGPHHFSHDTQRPDCPQLKMLRIHGSLFFGAVDHVQQALTDVDARTPGQKHLLLACTGVNFIDLSGAHLLAQEAQRRRAMGGSLSLVNVRDPVLQVLRQSGSMKDIGERAVIPVGAADPIDAVFGQLDPAVCATCTRRIFTQCRGAPGA
ncbi:MAG: SulP family inorganic anion transporter [Rubrivivax sp.]|jgi:SulP family sulfate permease